MDRLPSGHRTISIVRIRSDAADLEVPQSAAESYGSCQEAFHMSKQCRARSVSVTCATTATHPQPSPPPWTRRTRAEHSARARTAPGIETEVSRGQIEKWAWLFWRIFMDHDLAQNPRGGSLSPPCADEERPEAALRADSSAAHCTGDMVHRANLYVVWSECGACELMLDYHMRYGGKVAEKTSDMKDISQRFIAQHVKRGIQRNQAQAEAKVLQVRAKNMKTVETCDIDMEEFKTFGVETVPPAEKVARARRRRCIHCPRA